MPRKRWRWDGPQYNSTGWLMGDWRVLKAEADNCERNRQLISERARVREYLSRHPELLKQVLREIEYSSDPEHERELKAACYREIERKMREEEEQLKQRQREQLRRLEALRKAQKGDWK